MSQQKVVDLTVKELRNLIREVVIETLHDFVGDP